MSDKTKYGNLDELLPDDTESEVADTSGETVRRKRPSPALSAMAGDSKPTSITDSLRADKQAAQLALTEAQETWRREKEGLLLRLTEAGGTPIILTMPVTKQEITFELKRIDPSLIDVSPENERIQQFLDEVSLQDILPSIRKHGQQKPGTVRPAEGGRYELIEGSRRLAAVKLAKGEYLALVGSVPDADVRELGVIENKHKDVSPYEKAKAYLRQIENGEYENWTQLGAAKGISSSHIARYRACAQLDEIYVRILPSPSDMPLSYGETIAQLIKKGGADLVKKAQELCDLRQKSVLDKQELPDAEEVLKILKSAVRIKTEEPKTWKPVVYKSKDGNKSVKHSVTNQGATKFELSGLSQDEITSVLDYLKNTFKIFNQH